MSEQKSEGLTAEQVALIKETWGKIYADKVQSGVDLFIAFFQAYPHYKNHFKQFRELTVDQLKTSPKMKAHATTVMGALHTWVENLTDQDVLVELIRKNAIRHDGRGLTKNEFHHLYDMFPAYLEMKLGGEWQKEDVQTAWKKVVGVMSAVTDAAIDEDKETKY